MTFGKTHREEGSVSTLGFLVELSVAILVPVYPLIISDILGSDSSASIYFVVAAIIMLVFNSFSSLLFSHISRRYILSTSLAAFAIMTLMLILVSNPAQLMALSVVRYASMAFITLAIGMYVRDKANSKMLGRAESHHYQVINSAWLVGPILGGLIAQSYGIRTPLLLSFLMIVVAVSFYLTHKFRHRHLIIRSNDDVEKLKPSKEVKKNIVEFFKTKQAKLVWLTGFSIHSIWAMRAIYIPLYMYSIGISIDMIGVYFFISNLILVCTEQFSGIIADEFGVKVPLVSGFFINGLSLILIAFTSEPGLILAFTIIANIGLGLAEPQQEAYLYKVIKKKDEERFYGVFSSSKFFGRIVTPIIGLIILNNTHDISFIFALFGVISFIYMFAFCFVRIKKSKVERLKKLLHIS
jgi:MFS family permease